MVSNQAKDLSFARKEDGATQASGNRAKWMHLEHVDGKMVLSIKVNGVTASKKGKGLWVILMARSSLESSLMIYQTGKVRSHLQMEAFMLGRFKMECFTGKANTSNL